MSCQNKYHKKRCQNAECTPAIEAKCRDYLPTPPRMTEQEYRDQVAELLEPIPQEFRSAMSYHAYESGHSAGYEEIIIHLSDLVHTFAQPINDFHKRIIKETEKEIDIT